LIPLSKPTYPYSAAGEMERQGKNFEFHVSIFAQNFWLRFFLFAKQKILFSVFFFSDLNLIRVEGRVEDNHGFHKNNYRT
jgi:hypothetical protein